MAFVRFKGKTKIMYFKKSDTAREVRAGGLVKMNDSGSVAPPQNDSTDRIVGVCRVNDTVTDTAYNVDQNNPQPGMVPVEVPVELGVEWLVDLDSDVGALDTDIGRYCAIDTTGGGSVSAGDSAGMRADVNDTAVRQLYITGRQSGSRIIACIARPAFMIASNDTAGAS